MFRPSRFHELLQFLPRSTFEAYATQCGAHKHVKRFSPWHHLLSMLFAQLCGTSSLRELQSAFNAQAHQHYHLGVGQIKRSTLADANATRTQHVFELALKGLLGAVNRKTRQSVRDVLYLLDSTPIPLQGPQFDHWTQANRIPRTQGLKVHVLLDGQENVPHWMDITAPNVNDLSAALALDIHSGARYVFDKGYCDYSWWHRIDQQGAWFVTRLKHNARVSVLKVRQPSGTAEIICDEDILLSNKRPGGGRINPWNKPLRRVTVKRPETDKPLVLVSNDLHSSAEQIAQQYKARWGIELFFKWVKQHLKIKRFLGTSPQAVRTQLLTAIIAYLLVWLLHKAKNVSVSLWMFLVELRHALFERPELSERRRRRQDAKHLHDDQMGLAL